jgi:hypothetical protein
MRQHGCISILHCCSCLYHAQMVLSLGRSFVYFARNAHCTVTTDLLMWYSSTQNDSSAGAAFFSLHTLALPSGRNVNYDEEQLSGEKIFELFLLSVRFCRCVSSGFPIINFCNPRVRYEMPCILVLQWFDNYMNFIDFVSNKNVVHCLVYLFIQILRISSIVLVVKALKQLNPL